MEQRTKLIIALITLILLVIAVLSVAGYFAFQGLRGLEKDTFGIQSESVEHNLTEAERTAQLFKDYNISLDSCKYEDIGAIALCLNQEVESFYHYNISNVGKSMSLEQLFTEGGVCQHYAEYYTMRAISLGINGTNVVFPTSGQYFHQVSIISSDDGYCLMDMENFQCYYFGSVELEEKDAIEVSWK